MQRNTTTIVNIVNFGFMNVEMVLKTTVRSFNSCVLVAVLLLQLNNSGKFFISRFIPTIQSKNIKS